MKKFLITLLLSSIVVLGIWVVPEMNKEALPESELIETPEGVFEHRQGMYNPNLQLDTIPIAALEEMPVIAEREKKETDWQALITWIIGSLNGMFGLAVMAKKVFGKS